MKDVPTVPAEHFMATLNANVDNEKLSDADFREFVRNTMKDNEIRNLRAERLKLEAELPDDYSESKDWKQGNAVSRIQWLKAMMESYRFEVERLETQLLGNPE